MAKQIKKDDPAALTYTTQELQSLVKLNPSPNDLKRIHETKTIFPGSKVIGSETKGEILDRALVEIDREIPAGLDLCLSENAQGLTAQILEAEDRVNEVYKFGSVSELRTVLDEYKGLYRQARKRMKK